MTAKDSSAYDAMTILRQLKQYDDFNPAVYFDMAARQLLNSHGAQAIVIAEAAIVRMRGQGDNEGCALWEEVRNAMAEYADDMIEMPAPRYATMH